VGDYPIRHEKHETGERAVRRFKYVIPSRWVVNDAGQSEDYGWDQLIAISEQSTREVRDEFYVQVREAAMKLDTAAGTLSGTTNTTTTNTAIAQSAQCADFLREIGAGGGDRTHTSLSGPGILSPIRGPQNWREFTHSREILSKSVL
jgi:hypothetical protein